MSSVLDALIDAAVDATGAARGWLLAADGPELVVVAASGRRGPVGARGPGATSGWAGSVMQSGLPVALVPAPDDPRFRGDLIMGPGERPTSLLCFPCRHQGRTVGGLQLVDKAQGAPFSIDDVEIVTWLADVAGAALDDTGTGAPTAPPGPGELGAALGRLAAQDPARYRAVATVIAELLAPG